MELEFEKYCVVDGSPTTVLPSPRKFSKVERKPNSADGPLNQYPDLNDISSCIYQSTSCNSTPYNRNNEMLKRGSVYRSSKELSETKKIGIVEGTKRIELPRFGILDSLRSLDEKSCLVELDGSSFRPLNLEPNTSVGKQRIETCSDFLDLSFSSVSERISGVSSDGFLEISLDSFGPLNNGNGLKEDDSSLTLHKSLSDKLAQPHYSPCRSEGDWSESSSSPRTGFSPFFKSESQISPLGSVTQHGVTKTLQKSLLGNFSNTQSNSQIPCSPAHLRGLLKTGNKRGLPFFEFSVKLTEEILVARMWKMGNALNWVYTFHKKQRSNSTGWGLKDSYKESCTIAQMQVSCYLCTELNDNGAFDNSMVTEFVLYNIEQARKNRVTQDNSCISPNAANPQNGSNKRAQVELNPSLEIAAVVIKVPFEKRESLKCKRGDKSIDEPVLNLVNLYNIDKRKKDISDCLSTAKVNVITPLGSHSLPASESCRPSSLLDRWRYGGGCDCGGWDMGCPLLVSGNRNIRYDEEQLVVVNQQPLELFVQGAKEKTPALTMSIIKEGQYEVDFHAQFTTLQAFSICVAILHSMETTTSVEQEREKQLSHCDLLRVYVGEEVECLIEASTEEETTKMSKQMEEKPPPSFVFNPPFSPMARA